MAATVTVVPPKSGFDILAVLAKAREVSHSAVAAVGLAAGSVGAIVSALNTFGLHIGSADAAHFLLVAGVATTAVSKGIDSLNDALKSLGVK